jgi:hypothetical protein
VLDENNAGAFDAEIRQDAIVILGDLRESWLSSTTWARVDEALSRMAKAIADGDQAEVRSATIALELLSPRRTDPIGAMDEKPQKKTDDEIVDLIHALGGDKAPPERREDQQALGQVGQGQLPRRRSL